MLAVILEILVARSCTPSQSPLKMINMLLSSNWVYLSKCKLPSEPTCTLIAFSSGVSHLQRLSEQRPASVPLNTASVNPDISISTPAHDTLLATAVTAAAFQSLCHSCKHKGWSVLPAFLVVIPFLLTHILKLPNLVQELVDLVRRNASTALKSIALTN